MLNYYEMQSRHIILIQLASSEGLSKGRIFPKGTLSSLLCHDLQSCPTCVRTHGLRVNPHETPTDFKGLNLSRCPVQLNFRLPRDSYRRSVVWPQVNSTWGAWSTIWRYVEPLPPGVQQESVQLLTAPAAGRMALLRGEGGQGHSDQECVSTRLAQGCWLWGGSGCLWSACEMILSLQETPSAREGCRNSGLSSSSAEPPCRLAELTWEGCL